MKNRYWIVIFLINTLIAISCNNEKTERPIGTENTLSEDNNPVPSENDNTPPTIALNASSLQFGSTGNLTLTATAEDASGISKIDIYQGDTLLSSSSSSPATARLNITSANNGQLVFTAVAFDNATPANSTTSGPVTVQVNITTTASNCRGSVSGSTVKRFNEIADGTGRLREVQIETSAAYKNGENAPIVIVFHGYGGSIDASGFNFINTINNANDTGIVVTPQGVKGSGNGWDESPNGYDMPFFDNILTYVDEHYCADLSRVFVTGFSWGGDMTNALACLRGDKIRGIANFSGGGLANQINACTTTNYPAVFFRYGTIGGDNGDNVYSLQNFEAVANFYKEALGVSNNSTSVDPSPCEQFSSGSQPLIICADPTIGHFVPSSNEEKSVWSFWMGLP